MEFSLEGVFWACGGHHGSRSIDLNCLFCWVIRIYHLHKKLDQPDNYNIFNLLHLLHTQTHKQKQKEEKKKKKRKSVQDIIL